MLGTPRNSTRTVTPATAVTHHITVRGREKAGRSRRIAFHQIPHSDSGSPRSGMVASMVQVGSGQPIGNIDFQFFNHVWAHDPDATRRAALRYSGTARWISRRTHRRANTKTGRDGPDRVEDLMSKQRREQSQDSIFVDNPFADGFLEWMGSREGRQCIQLPA